MSEEHTMTNLEVLIAFAPENYHRGVFICEPRFSDPLHADDLIELVMSHIPERIPTYQLTDKGIAALALIRGERAWVPYEMPDWVLQEATKRADTKSSA